jgi:hypothetical protein
MAEAILQLLSEAGKRHVMGLEGRARAADTFSIRSHVEGVERVYRELVG